MRARTLTPSPENIGVAAQALRDGRVVGMPTETVYGLAGDALRPEALARIFETKERPTFDPLIIHVAPTTRSLTMLEQLELIDGRSLSPLARQRAETLIQTFWPGPLTLVLPKHSRVPDLATSGLPTVALRMPAHPVAQKLIEAAGTPLAAPSANRFGRISPTTADAVAEELGDRIDWILDGGLCEIGVESTVVAIESDGNVRQLRPGGTPRSRIEQVIGCALSDAEPKGAPGLASPGMLESHYAPARPLYLLTDSVNTLRAGKIAKKAPEATSFAFLLQSEAPRDFETRIRSDLEHELRRPITVSCHALSKDGNLSEIARNLFSGLRALDTSGSQILLAEACPIDQGLGHAIADRLGRASRGKIERSEIER